MHPAIEVLLPRIRNGTDECDMAEAMGELRAVLIVAAEEMLRDTKVIKGYREGSNLLNSPTGALVAARLLGEETP